MLSSLNLAALQQANKRRRRETLSWALQADGAGHEPGDGLPTTTVTTAQSFPDFLSDEDIVEVASIGSVVESESDSSEEEDDENDALITSDISAVAAAAAKIPSLRSRPVRSPRSTPGGAAHLEGRSVARGAGGTRGSCDTVVGGSSDEWSPFVPVAKEHLVGTWLAVFVRASMLKYVSDVRSGENEKFPRKARPTGSLGRRGRGGSRRDQCIRSVLPKVWMADQGDNAAGLLVESGDGEMAGG